MGQHAFLLQHQIICEFSLKLACLYIHSAPSFRNLPQSVTPQEVALLAEWKGIELGLALVQCGGSENKLSMHHEHIIMFQANLANL